MQRGGGPLPRVAEHRPRCEREPLAHGLFFEPSRGTDWKEVTPCSLPFSGLRRVQVGVCPVGRVAGVCGDEDGVKIAVCATPNGFYLKPKNRHLSR